MPHPSQGYTNAKGESVPGATTVLGVLNNGGSDGLMSWAATLAREGKDWRSVRTRSADLGTFIHDCLEKWPDALPMRPPWMNEQEWKKVVVAYSEYTSWRLSIAPVVVAQEKQAISEKLQAGGTFDCIFKIGNDLVIADHKTGKSIDKPKVAAQLSFYAAMAEEVGIVSEPIKRGLILHYTETGLKTIELSEQQMAKGLELFKTARAAYTLFRGFPRA